MNACLLVVSGVLLEAAVVRESHAEVDIAVEYRLATHERVFLTAITLYAGRSTGHWAYRPTELGPGRHRAVVTVSMSREAPELYWSDAFEIEMNGDAQATLTYPYRKLWCQNPDPCRDAELEPLRKAPLEERLTSVQPSIRASAIASLDGLEEVARRRLLPAIAERMHHADLGVRLNALDILKRFGLADPLLTLPLSQAMRDPHPGIARVATAVLSELAVPDDAPAERALREAAASADDSTRGHAQAGLRRIEHMRRQARKPVLGVPLPETLEACAAAGGRWGTFGLYRIPECSLPTPDAGTRCSDGIECVSACVAESDAGAPLAGTGKCYAWTILRGTCLNYVELGMIQPALCVD